MSNDKTLPTVKHGGCVQLGTPGSRWASTGQPDPHGSRYDCERAALEMGDLSDDELANAVFMHGDRRLSVAEMISGVLPGSAYLAAAKDRIRWLSRTLAAAEALSAQPSPGGQGDARAIIEEFVQCATLGRPHGKLIAQAKDYLAARQPVCATCAGSRVDPGGLPVCRSCNTARQTVGEPVVYDAGLFGSHPYFECTPEQWERHTKGMTEKGERVLANMLAHHCLLARRDDRGWLITRSDLIRSGKPWWHVSNEGVLTYDYDPDTKARAVTAPPAQAVDLGMQQDAARWRAIAPHLSVEWDEDEMLKRWTWIDFKGDALSVPSRTRESYASVEEAIDAVIDSQAVGK